MRKLYENFHIPPASLIIHYWYSDMFLVQLIDNFERLHLLFETRVSKWRDVPGQTGMGRPVVPLSWDKKVSLSRCPFVPGQKSFLVPLSFWPGTRAAVNIPGQDSLSRNVPRDKITLFGLSVGHFASFLVSRSVNLHPFCIIFGQLVSRSVSQFFSKMFLIFFSENSKIVQKRGPFWYFGKSKTS